MTAPARPPRHIQRTAGTLALEGVRAATLNALLDALQVDGRDPEALVVSDLSLGAWKSHQVAREFCQQLGMSFEQSTQPELGRKGATHAPPAYADLMGDWIDAEARGDRTVTSALEAAGRFVASVGETGPRTFVVIAPRYGLGWEAENLQFIRFLAHGLRGSGHRLTVVCAGEEDTTLPPDWLVNWTRAPEGPKPEKSVGLLGLVPGIVLPGEAAAVESSGRDDATLCLNLGHGCMLVAPECRRPPSEVSRFVYDRLAAAACPLKWLEAYAQFFGNNLYVDPSLLVDEASRLISEGSHGTALRLLRRAAACAKSPVLRASYESQVQGMCIALHRFREMADAPSPPPNLPRELRGALFQAKGWGLVMADDPARGLPYLEEAGALLEPHYGGSREYLYFLNIYALARLKAGDPDGALELERRVETHALRHVPPDWRLIYINSINIARLLRRAGDYEAAGRYYDRAFATTLGVRSESDTIYTNVCRARLRADRGEMRESFIYWLRASLHWVSSTAPEALGQRVAAAIVSRGLSTTEGLEENVSASLVSLLLDSAGKSSLVRADLPAELHDLEALPAPSFVRADGAPKAAFEQSVSALAAGGLGLLLTREKLPTVFSGANHLRLRALLYDLLKRLSPEAIFEGARSILVDDRLGREIPADALELLEACVRLSVPKVVFGSVEVELDAARREGLERLSRVRIGAAVAGVELGGEVPYVTYKRYMPPKPISSTASRIIASLDDCLSMQELAKRVCPAESFRAFADAVRSLERERLLEVYLTEDACARAGVELPSGEGLLS